MILMSYFRGCLCPDGCRGGQTRSRRGNTVPTGYRVRDVEFLAALTIPESSTIDIRFSLRPSDSATWHDFDICSLGTTGAWNENCKGRISWVDALYTSPIPSTKNFLGLKRAARIIDVPSMIAGIGEMSIVYGPAFQNLTCGEALDKKAAIDSSISRAASEAHTCIVHPTTLDCIIQTSYYALPTNISKKAIVLPRSNIDNVYTV